MVDASHIRMLHVSDFHLARASAKSGLKSSSKLSILTAAAETAYKLHRKKGLHAILISGDLAHSGCRDDLELARQVVATPPLNKRKPWVCAGVPVFRAATVNGKGREILAVPGDHDRHQGAPGGTGFDDVLHAVWPAPPDHVCSPVCLPSQADPKLAIVRADLTLDDTAVVMGGRSGQWQEGDARPWLNRLEVLTIETQNRGLPVVWMLHFAPAFDGLEEHKKLRGEWNLLGKARNLHVPWILCGHTHRHRTYGVDPRPGRTHERKKVGIPVVHCAGSACLLNKGDNEHLTPSLHLLDFVVVGPTVANAEITTWEWDGRAFAPVERRRVPFDEREKCYRLDPPE